LGLILFFQKKAVPELTTLTRLFYKKSAIAPFGLKHVPFNNIRTTQVERFRVQRSGLEKPQTTRINVILAASWVQNLSAQ
jgi:hypothetical protein